MVPDRGARVRVSTVATTMLVSTKILRQYSDRTQVAREWRVIQVPEEDAALQTS